MERFFIMGGTVVLPDKTVDNLTVEVKNGKISGLYDEDVCIPEGGITVDLQGGYLLSGFVDIHVHGGGGSDFMDGSVENMANVVNTHVQHGTTTVFPTTMSCAFTELLQTFETYRAFIKSGKSKANLGGLHLEGPFLNPKMCGAQRPDLIISPEKYHIDKLIENADIIARITCAPEEKNVMKMAEKLKRAGIQISMGHTGATYEQAEEATESGFTSVTHLYSATSGFHKVGQKVHVGVTQAGYGIDDLYVELIGDGCHVPKELLRLVHRFKGTEKICLVTDAMRAAGTNVSESYLGKVCPENRVIIDDGVAKLPDKSCFAGSIGTMDRAFKFAVENARIPLNEAGRMVSLTPATLMNMQNRKGSIEVGKDADLVVMNHEFITQKVFVNGKLVYENK